MTHRQIATEPKTFVLLLQTGDELAEQLLTFAKAEHISGASFKAVGAFSSVKLAWFNPDSKKYDTCVELEEQVELLSLRGDIAEFQETPAVHAHVVVGLRDGTTRADIYRRLSSIPLVRSSSPRLQLTLRRRSTLNPV